MFFKFKKKKFIFLVKSQRRKNEKIHCKLNARFI